MLVRVERDVALVVGLLGVLAAGAAFVPIDPEHPPSRQRLIAECSGAAVAVVTFEAWMAVGIDVGNGAEAKTRWRQSLSPSVRSVVCLNRSGEVQKVLRLEEEEEEEKKKEGKKKIAKHAFMT